VPAMEKFQDLGFRVKLVYWESGMCYCGLFDENGDDYMDYTDMTADEVDAAINEEVDECMCIVENLREWEEQNAEEEDETPHEFATPGSFTIEDGLNKENK